MVQDTAPARRGKKGPSLAKKLRPHAERWPRLRVTPVKRMQGGAVLRRCGEMQRVAGAKPQHVLIDEFCRRAEMRRRNRQDGKTLSDQLVEHRKRSRPLLEVDLPVRS